MTETLGPRGKFVWYEYMSDDIDAAAEFYSHVVGWNIKDGGMTDFRYLIAHAGEYPVGGLMTIPAEAKAMGAPACWTGYIWVEDVDAAAKALVDKGGKVFREPTDIPHVGRFAVVADPQGGTFMLFRDAGGAPPPAPAANTPGLVAWHELHADEGAAAMAFYQDFFGWKKDSEFNMGEMGAYNLFSTGHGEFGGIMTKMPQTPGPFWLYYFNVDSVDAAAGRIKEWGGKIAHGPMEVPGGTFTLQGFDPQGALFALHSAKR